MFRVCCFICVFSVSFTFIRVAAEFNSSLAIDCSSVCTRVEMAYESDNTQCDIECRKNSCIKGCVHWRESSTSSCQDICHQSSGWPGGNNIDCTLGCVFATQSYMDKAKDLIGEDDAPQLIGGTITSGSVGLRWTSVTEIPGVKYLVQYRQGTGTGEWHYYEPDNLLIHSHIYVKNLMPFTKYQFRVAWIIVANRPPLFSGSSPWISTSPAGPPQSPPRNVRAVTLDWHRVEVLWEAPSFPGGDLISYTLYLRQENGTNKVRKDIEAQLDRRYVVSRLEPNTTYEVRLSATNHKGEGPPAVLKVTTYPRASAVDDGRGYLLLTSGSSLLRIALDIMEQPKYVYNTSSGSTITGIAVHIPLKFIYISDATGTIYQIHTKVVSKSHRVLLTPEQIGGRAVNLSIDWLFGFLYIVLFIDHPHPKYWQIWRCDLMGNSLTLIMNGLPYQPQHLAADPYNGYIWWISDDVESGLHRLSCNSRADVSELVSSTVVHRSPHFGGIAVDAPNFRIFVADQINNTILAISLDGTSVSDARNNTQQAFFKSVTSLVILGGKFFWTNGKEVYSEELNEGTFYHNSYALLGSGVFSHLVAMHRSVQPIPVPLNPPQEVQALFSSKSATITWSKPLLPALTDRGAWQEWKYEVQLQEGQKIIYNTNLNSTKLVVTNLLHSTFYNIKVRAYSKSGAGPWSAVFNGRTLSYHSSKSKLLWVTNNSLISTDLDGQSSEVFTLGQQIKNYQLLTDLTHVTYYKDSIIASLPNRTCHLVNLTSGTVHPILGTSGVHATAVDWATSRVFGAHPKNNTIVWSHLDGSSIGTLEVLTVGLELGVDSFRGLLYWRTRYGVFRATLTGRNISELHQENIFSGRVVQSLSLDANTSVVWWVVRDEFGCHLYDSSQRSESTAPVRLPYTVREGSMHYASERLLWLSDEGELIIYDPALESTAVVKAKHLEVRYIAVRFVPPPIDDVNLSGLLPDSINPMTIKTKGTWRNFTIVWEPLKRPDFRSLHENLKTKVSKPFSGDLRYEVSLLGRKERASYVTSKNDVTLPWSVDAYSPLTVLIRGLTNWGIGRNAIVDLRTPSDIPLPPTNVRIYIKDEAIHTGDIILRWNSPQEPHGEIEKYKISLSKTPSSGAGDWKISHLGGNEKLEMHFNLNWTLNVTYTFKVTAFTYVGEGPPAILKVLASDKKLTSIPSLLVVSSSSLQSLDADTGQVNYILPESTIRNAAVDLVGKFVIWLDDHSDLFRTTLNGARNETERLLRLDGEGNAISFDWIGGTVYWVETDPTGSKWIKQFDINFKTSKTIFHFSNESAGSPIQTLSSPSNNSLYVLEERNSVRTLRVWPLDGGSSFDLFYGNTRISKNCTCPKSPSLSKGIALDTSQLQEPRLYFNLEDTAFEGHQKSSILSTDSSGCQCTLVAVLQDYGFEKCDAMSVDAYYLYCFDSTNSALLWMKKEGPSSKNELYKRKLDGVNYILPLSTNTQPMPSLKCLIVSSHEEKPYISLSQEASIALRLPLPKQSPSDCGLIPLPPSIYLIYYEKIANGQNVSTCATNVNMCNMVKSQTTEVVISDLEPFTKYVFRVAFETAYNSRFRIPVQPGPPAVFKTRAKKPDGANSVTATAISPEEIKVTFKVPFISSFEVHWSSHKADKGFTGLKYTSRHHQSVTAIVEKLQADTRYEIWVRIYSMDDPSLFTDSPRVISVTYPVPPKIILLRNSSRSLDIQWTAPVGTNILRHSIQYKEENDKEWSSTAVEQTFPAQKYQYTLESLTSATSYALRLQLIYNTTEHNTFVWPRLFPFRFNTSGDVPGVPGMVRIQHVEGGWEARWNFANPNGNVVVAYELQMATLIEEYNITFVTVYNGSDNFWFVSPDFDPTLSYIFRVRGMNALGEGPWSNPSNIRSPAGTSRLSAVHLPTILGATIPSCLMFFAVLLTCLTMGIRRADEKRRKAKAETVMRQVAVRGRELELATVPHLPNNNNFVSENNILYNMQSFSSDDIDLPRIPKNSIILTKFLGSGAFGEVYEGTVMGLPGRSGITKVAIKTLRKGATESEKSEFLKEAQLMSHFQHDHILRLLALCTDLDPFYLILELMQGGDLLSYLRANRGVENGFTLLDLLNMCVDVAKGCVYLEDMHFVHRDIAARNCLVSCTDPEQRIVKIGDFGLARDIYKNDYYRKEGEGLLPVRWMSPESLIDGVFTTQSDVWAFGVLLWEIMTLGQQPYPARTNLQVLHYVRTGGKPTRPPSCPEDLQNLTQTCWSYNPDDRPTFKECLRVLLVLQETVAALPSLNVHNFNYMSATRWYGLDNLAYTSDREEIKQSGTSTLPMRDESWNAVICSNGGAVESTSGASTVPVTAPLQRQQQYLQLVNDMSIESDSATLVASNSESDSYENTVSSCQSRENDACSLSTEFTSVASTSLPSDITPVSLTDSPETFFSLDSSAIGDAVLTDNVGYLLANREANIHIHSPSNLNSDAVLNGGMLHHEYFLPVNARDQHSSFLQETVLPSDAMCGRRKNSLPLPSVSRKSAPVSSLPSSPSLRSPNQSIPFLLSSPVPDSPTSSITFTFPQQCCPGNWLENHHFMQPMGKQNYESLSRKPTVTDEEEPSPTFSFKDMSRNPNRRDSCCEDATTVTNNINDKSGLTFIDCSFISTSVSEAAEYDNDRHGSTTDEFVTDQFLDYQTSSPKCT